MGWHVRMEERGARRVEIREREEGEEGEERR